MRFPWMILAAALTVVPAAGWACSTCKCADNTITLFGTEKAFSGRFRIALDHYVRAETSGTGVGEQTTDEARTTLGIAYSLTPDLTLALQIPYVQKELESASLARQEASGLGDIDLSARWVLYRSGALTGRHLAGLRGGVRLPTSDEVEEDGVLLDIDVQPDAGAAAPNIGAWYSYYRFPWFLNLSASYYHFGEGNQDFQAGDSMLASLLAQYGINEKLAAQAGLDLRHSDRNEFSGQVDADSGGTLGMGFVGVAIRVGEELLLNAGYQSPILEDLNGEQKEDSTFRVGMAYDF